MRAGDSGYTQYLTWVIPETIPGPAVPIATAYDDGQLVPDTETWFLHNWSVDILDADVATAGAVQIVLTAYNSSPDLQYGRVASIPIATFEGPLSIPLQTGIIDPPLLLPGGTIFYLDLLVFAPLAGTYTNIIRTAMVTRLTGAIISNPFIATPPI